MCKSRFGKRIIASCERQGYVETILWFADCRRFNLFRVACVCTDGTSAMSSKFVHVWCASVPELNDSLILTADTVQRLVNSCHDTCELSDDVVMPLTKVSRVVTHSVAKKRSSSVDYDTNDTMLQTNSDVSDNTGTSLNGSAASILSDDVVSADYLDDCDPSKASNRVICRINQ